MPAVASDHLGQAEPEANALRWSAFVVAVCLLFALTQYRELFSLPFLNDDYIFLEKVRSLSFGTLWQRQDPTFGFYRPWSREFHYWALQHLFGPPSGPITWSASGCGSAFSWRISGSWSGCSGHRPP